MWRGGLWERRSGSHYKSRNNTFRVVIIWWQSCCKDEHERCGAYWWYNICNCKKNLCKLKKQSQNGRFTVIGLTAASEDAVICIIFFTAEELTFAQQMGYDIYDPYDGTKTIKENSGKGKAFPGTPTCFFCGKNIPALIAMSPKGSITSEILKCLFEKLDKLQICERTENRTPMILYVALNSRLQVPCLRYINNPTHLWKFCIGLCNGTHTWQVGDSKE